MDYCSNERLRVVGEVLEPADRFVDKKTGRRQRGGGCTTYQRPPWVALSGGGGGGGGKDTAVDGSKKAADIVASFVYDCQISAVSSTENSFALSLLAKLLVILWPFFPFPFPVPKGRAATELVAVWTRLLSIIY